MSAKTWSDRVAAFAVDALLDAKIVKKEDFERAVEVVAEEIYARLCLQDTPPPMETDHDT